MRNKKLLAIVLLSLSFCFVSGVGYAVIDEELSDMIKVSRMEYLLLKAKVKYMMRNPTNFLDIDFWYDAHGFGRLFTKWPIGIDTKKKIVVEITDSRNIFLNKSGVALLEAFKEHLEVAYSFIDDIATNMKYDIVAKIYSKGDIPLGYFYQGEYHLWGANMGEKTEKEKVASSEPFLFENIEIWKIRRVRSGATLGTKVTGEIVNQSGVNYVSHAWFRVTLYDSQGEVLGWREFTTFDLKDGQRKKFEAKFYDVESNSVWDYKIEFDRGS